MMEENKTIAKSFSIRDAAEKVTGSLRYTADRKLPRMLYAKVLFSPLAHARIRAIDTSATEALPGVRAVLTHRNTPQTLFNSCGEEIDGTKNERVFDPVVRYVGDKVAAVAADSIQIAEAAIKLIRVDYEELPHYLDPEGAMAADAYPIHAGGNVAEVVSQSCGDVETGFAQAERIFEHTYRLPAIHHAAIETHTALADYDAAGKLTVWTPSQDVFGHRTNLSRIFSLPMSRVRVVVPAIGGGFGGKIDMVCEPIAAALAIATGRPVRLVYTRREDIPSSRCRHAMVVRLKTGVQKDGMVTAQRFDVTINAGAHAGGTSSVVWAMCGKLFRFLKTPNIAFTGTAVYTNTLSAGAMRGFGSPQEFFAQQRQFHEIAKVLGLDMTELLATNLIAPDGKDRRFDSDLGNPRPLDCVERGKALFGWETALAEQERSRREQGRWRIGVGMAAAAHGNGVFGVRPDTTGVMIKMNEDGSAVFFTGVCDMGNGSVSLQQQIIAQVLGLEPSRIACVQADTDATLFDLGNYSSRGTFVSGNAAKKVALALREELLREAAQLLNVPRDSLELCDGKAVADNGASATLEELVHHARQTNQRDLVVADTFAADAMAVSYGAHFVKVRLDTESGQVEVLDYVAVHDVGRALNPMNVEGQIEGAVQMGLGYALSEEIVYDETGRVKNPSFRNYRLYRVSQMPPIRIALVEEHEPGGPYGAKSIGECSVVPAPAAIINAVSAAAEREFNQLPVRPEVIRAAWAQKEGDAPC